jgi:uncharacterized Fe-S cluster protein YjdI
MCLKLTVEQCSQAHITIEKQACAHTNSSSTVLYLILSQNPYIMTDHTQVTQFRKFIKQCVILHLK